MHLRVDSVACGVGENFKKFVEPLLLEVGDIAALWEALPFLDDNLEKVLRCRINIDLAAQLRQTLIFTSPTPPVIQK